MSHTVNQMIELGARERVNGEVHHVYFTDLAKLRGLDVSFYKTGNIRFASLDGEKLSISKAFKLLLHLKHGEIWFDVKTGKFSGKGIDQDHFEIIVSAIKTRLERN